MISIVIPVHNRISYTRQCLACIAAQTYRNFRVVVVDDGSTDGTSEMIRQEYPDTIVLRGDGNLWWTEATNWGVRYAQEHRVADQENLVLTLNDDTSIAPDYLQTMVDAYQQHKPCLIGSVSVDSIDPNKIEYAGLTINPYLAGGRYLADRYNHDYRLLVSQTDHLVSDSLPGRGTLIPLAVFDEVGLYDSKNYIHYMSDIELSVRARKAGYRLIVNTRSLVLEYREATSSLINRKAGWRDFINGFTSFKSPNHLKIRYHFAVNHSKTKLLYFVVDVSRICGGFFLRKIGLVKTQ